ncbi:MAG: transglutaminase family protein [Verrucomicrobia bacterium]|nr:transglutaminase family protein [Verrucomicrobiota bacterium]
MLYEITHSTAYAYAGSVSVSHHLLRLAPRNFARQRCLQHELGIDPQPAATNWHIDYFGNIAHFITVECAHRQLTVTSRSQVAISPAFIPDVAETLAWQRVRKMCDGDHSGRALEAHEFTYASSLVPRSVDYADYARASFPADRPLLDAVVDLTRRISRDFKFDPKATSVATPLEEVFKQRRGVCQDFAHVQIACLRSLNLPARYVSGYLETDPPPGQPKLLGADASHAWTAFYCPGIGWIDVDPTNNCLPSMRHITVAWGRDFSDVSPVRGVLVGGGDHELNVAVDVIAKGPLPDGG